MPFVDSFRLALLDHLFGGDPTPQPTTSWWVGLSTTSPSQDGTNITEPAGASGYARAQVQLGDVGWSNATGGAPAAVSNAAIISFPTATASWGNCTHFVLFKTSTGNDPVAFDTLSPAVEVTTGTGAEFPPGELVFNAA